MQRIPAEQAFDKTDRRNYEEKDESQNDSGRHERESFRQCHPCFVWQNQSPWKQHGQNDKHHANGQSNMRQARKLSAIEPPGAQQNQNAADHETEFSFDPKRFLSNHLLVHYKTYQLIIQALHTFPNSHILPEWQTNLWSGLALRLMNCVNFQTMRAKKQDFSSGKSNVAVRPPTGSRCPRSDRELSKYEFIRLKSIVYSILQILLKLSTYCTRSLSGLKKPFIGIFNWRDDGTLNCYEPEAEPRGSDCHAT